MAQQPDAQRKIGNPLEEITQLARQCESLLREYEHSMGELEASLREVREKHAQVSAVRDQTRAALAGVQSVREQAEHLGLLASTPSVASHLRVVPNTPLPPPPPEPPADTPPSRVFLIRGEKTKQLLTVLATKPDMLWTSSDAAALLGLAKSDRAGRRRLRGAIRNLADRGLLERVVSEEGKKTYYRPLLNWRFEKSS